MARARKEIFPVHILADTRESTGVWAFQPEVASGEATVTAAALKVGDYSVRGMERLVAVERKAIPDLWHCVGADRRRFRRQMERLAALRWPALVVEGSLHAVATHRTRAHECDVRRLRAKSVVATLVAWSLELGVQCWLGGSPRESERLAFLWLRFAQRAWRAEVERLGGGTDER